jgi:heterodisulfide reductase subunit A
MSQTNGSGKTGVYICHCGGNISDYVAVEKVREAAAGEPGVAVAKTALFACSDATQQEMAQDIRELGLDGLVVASCSPKLHLFTFREVAKRAGLNPYRYVQVNIREQCSWAHSGDPKGATEKAVRLVRAGIARARLSEPLEPVVIRAVPAVLVVGAGIAGLSAALGLSDLGMPVALVERAPEAGGWVARWEKMYPHGASGKELVARLAAEVKNRENITLFTGAEVVEKTGSPGDFRVKVEVRGGPGAKSETVTLNVGAIIVATGFDPYRPREGEFGYGLPGVLTLPEFTALVNGPGENLSAGEKEIGSVAYIYCVGSRQSPGEGEPANRYCSRYCCNAAAHAAALAFAKNPRINQFHLCRDVRTYGRFELLYDRAMKSRSVFLKYAADEPPRVEQKGNGKLAVTVRDLLTAGEPLSLEVDAVVLVTGMVPAENGRLAGVLKLPVGKDGFFNEIHPKLRPVETAAGGIYICGAGQGPKNSAESVASALAAVAQAAALLKKGYLELEPVMAAVQAEKCAWCGACAAACPYAAIEKAAELGKEFARVNRSLCKGCGGCVPACPAGALDLAGYTDEQVRAAIAALAG